MHCIDFPAHQRLLAMAPAALLAALLAACAVKVPPPPPPAPSPRPAAAAPAPVPAAAPVVAPVVAPGAAAAAAPAAAAGGPRYVKLPAPATPRSAADLRAQFARRLVQAHPDTTYVGRVPERLLAIPVIEVELNADGSVRNIEVLRKPSTGNEATALAIDAIKRAAPYGDVSRLPRPWKVVETFLFDDNLKFKPRTLDQK